MMLATVLTSIASAISNLVALIVVTAVVSLAVVGIIYATFEKWKHRDNAIQIQVSEEVGIHFNLDTNPRQVRKSLFHAILTSNAIKHSFDKDGFCDMDRLIESFRDIQDREDRIEEKIRHYKETIDKIERMYRYSPNEEGENEG